MRRRMRGLILIFGRLATRSLCCAADGWVTTTYDKDQMGTDNARTCPCGTRLARDNHGSRCHACQKKARDNRVRPPAVGPGFWQDTTMRAALDTRDLGKVMHAFRTHPHHDRTITQETAAAWVGVSQSRLSRIEQGALLHDPARQIHWAHVLGVPTELLWFEMPGARPNQAAGPAMQADSEQAPPAVRTGQEAPEDPMRRRTLLTWGITATASAGMVGLDVSGGGRVGASEVAGVQRAFIRLGRLDQQHGGETLWRVTAGHVNEAHLMLEHGTYTETIGRQLLRTTARLQYRAGWLAYDAGQQTVARNCYTEPLALARQSGDAEVETFALAQLSSQSNALSRPREGLRFAVAADQAAASLREPSVLPVIPHLRQAKACALLGDARASDQAVTQARKVLDRHGDQPTEEWLAFIGQAEIDGVEASCATELGRASRAAALLEQAIADKGDRFVRNRALDRVHLARVRLDRKEVDGAVEAAHAALDDVSNEVASWRVSSDLDAVAQRLTKYPDVTGVDSFLDRYQAMNRPQSL